MYIQLIQKAGVCLFFWLTVVLSGKAQISKAFPRDTSFTAWSTYVKVKKTHPYIQLVEPAFPQGITAYENIVYAVLPDTPYGIRELHVDIYRKNDNKKYPALLMVHGGGWNSGDRTLQRPMAQQISKYGYVTIPVEYRLRPEAIYPAALYDLKAAVRWVRENAERYGIDTTRIAISGCSAGGHLATLVGMTNSSERHENKKLYADHSSSVQAVINIDGCSTFISPRNIAETKENIRKLGGKLPINALWLGGSYDDKKDIWEDASPIVWVSDSSAPVCFINGQLERYHDGRDDLIEKLKSHGIYSESFR